MEKIYLNEDSILEVIYNKNHPFFNKYSEIYTKKEEKLVYDFHLLLEFSEKFTEKMAEYKNKGIKIYFKYDSDYPSNLFSDEGPLFLYCYGDFSLLKDEFKKVAIIGTRNATKLGEERTSEYVKNYVNQNWVTISGLAKGIDTVVHRETVNNLGRTIAVLPTSFEKIYPAENKSLFEKIYNNKGLIVSKVGPFENTYKSNFLERNSIVARLSNEILIMEASVKSGTLNTVRKGYEYGKRIFYDSTLLESKVVSYISRFKAIDICDKGGRG